MKTEAEIKADILEYEAERRKLDENQGEDRLLSPELFEFLTRVRGKCKKDEIILRAMSKFYTLDDMVELVKEIYMAEFSQEQKEGCDCELNDELIDTISELLQNADNNSFGYNIKILKEILSDYDKCTI